MLIHPLTWKKGSFCEFNWRLVEIAALFTLLCRALQRLYLPFVQFITEISLKILTCFSSLIMPDSHCSPLMCSPTVKPLNVAWVGIKSPCSPPSLEHSKEPDKWSWLPGGIKGPIIWFGLKNVGPPVVALWFGEGWVFTFALLEKRNDFNEAHNRVQSVSISLSLF